MSQKTDEILISYALCSKEEKEEVLKFVVLHKPPGTKLRNLFSEKELSKTAPFDLDLIDGQVGELAFLNIATSGKHEVKRDFMVSSTGRIAVELEYNNRPSCLSTTKAPYWVYWLSGDQYHDEIAVVITVKRLKKLAELGFKTRGGDGKKSLLSIFDVFDLLRPSDWIEKRLSTNQILLF